MSRRAEVYRNSILVGTLSEENDKTYTFVYDNAYLNNDNNPPVSLTMPKRSKVYEATYLFPFFFNMLAEGVNRKLQMRQLQISEDDHFGLLLATSSKNTIGAVHVKEIPIND
ncbi:HipA N-terminal domain-containing protein [Saprospiraceae bacterium]|nr:HipA N-terminal domain-containing protein [Saprospiraceae bacterium]